MTMLDRLSPRVRLALLAFAALLVLAVLLPGCLAPLVATQLRAQARARGLEARWDRLTFAWPLRVELRGLVATHAGIETPFVSAERVAVSLGARGLSLEPRIARLVLERVQVTLPSGGAE